MLNVFKEKIRLSRAGLAAAACALVVFAGLSAPAYGQDDRSGLTFTKTESAPDTADWKKKVSTGPKTGKRQAPRPESAPAVLEPTALAAVSTTPHSLHHAPNAEPAGAPAGLIPDKKVETNYDALREELKMLRPLKPGEDAGAVRVPAPVPANTKSGPAFAEASTGAAETRARVNEPAARLRPADPPKKPEPESTIGSASNGENRLTSPGRQSRPPSNRGMFNWFKRSRNQEPEISDPATVSPVPSRPADSTPEVIAQYPPGKMADEKPGQSDGAHSAMVSPANHSPEPKKRGIFSRLFGKKSQASKSAKDSAGEEFGETTLDRFPKLEEIRVKASKAELAVDGVVRQIQSEYEDRIERMTATDLNLIGTNGAAIVPRDLESAWFDAMQDNLWKKEERIAVPLRETYARALMNSNQVNVVSYIPLIGETGIGEAEGQFDPEFFAAGRRSKTDRPTNSELDTGSIGRFIENGVDAEAGLRKRFASTGGQIALSNRFSSLKNNSEFTFPNPQTSSDLVLSVRQPLLRGAGYHYNKATLKIAKLDADSAAGEYIRLLETHLLEVNRAYWGVYLARAAFLLRQSLVDQTAAIVERIESRADEATASELLRARSELSKRRTGLNRAEMGVRNAEERLRSLINDPEFPIGGSGEFIPMTRPVLAPPTENVKGAAREAVDNRTEIAQSFNQLRSSAIIEEAGRSELKPQFDLLGEISYAGIAKDRQAGRAYEDMFRHGTGLMAGLEFSQPWERNFAKSRQQRRTYEFLQQADNVRQTIDTVLLESVVTYREVLTAYRDMQGRYQEVILTREEVKALNERLEVDVDNKQTIAFQLQLIMDAIERNQIAEEQFLVSIVSYNIAFAALDRAKGTFLTYHDVVLDRVPDLENGKGLESIKASSPSSPVSPQESRTK